MLNEIAAPFPQIATPFPQIATPFLQIATPFMAQTCLEQSIFIFLGQRAIRAHIKIRVTPVGASNTVSCYESIETILWKSNTRK